MKREGPPSFQLVPYGFSIFTYMNRYDQAWKLAVQRLKEFLVLNSPIGITSTTSMPAKLSQQHHIALNYFPDESFFSVMSYLDNTDLCIVCSVSRSWNDLSKRDELWNNLLQKHFSVSSSDIIFQPRSKMEGCENLLPKTIYKEMYQTLRGVLNGMHGPKMKQPVVPAALLNYTMVM